MMYICKIKEYGKGYTQRLYRSKSNDEPLVKKLIQNSLSKYEQLIELNQINDPLHIELLSTDDKVKVFKTLIKKVCDELFISEETYYSIKKTRKLNMVKTIIYKLMRSHNMTLNSIAELHNRHHSSVIALLRTFERDLAMDKIFQRYYYQITELFDELLNQL